MSAELLSRVAAGRGAILSSRGLRGYDQVSVKDLTENLRDMTRHAETCRGHGSSEILKDLPTEDLGHAPAWIDAGAVYEDLVEFVQARGPLDYVICVDPWAAQLRSRAAEIAGNAQWILISDLADRRRDKKEYFEQLGEWFKSLSYSAVLSRKDCDVAQAEPLAAAPVESAVHARKPGAWEWRRFSAPQPACPLVLLVRYSGSLVHLKVFLDSLLRLEGRPDSLQVVLLTGSSGEDPRPYLRWISLAHPTLRLSTVTISRDWRSDLSPILGASPEATVGMIGDHVILPPQLLRLLKDGGRSVALGVPLPLEASAHILTGNLDALPNYETLMRSVSADARPECARFFGPGVLTAGGADPVEQLVQRTRQQADQRVPPLTFLETADLP